MAAAVYLPLLVTAFIFSLVLCSNSFARCRALSPSLVSTPHARPFDICVFILGQGSPWLPFIGRLKVFAARMDAPP